MHVHHHEVPTKFNYFLRSQLPLLNERNVAETGVYIFEITMASGRNDGLPDSFAVTSSKHDIQLYELEPLKWRDSLKGHTNRISRIRYSNSHKHLIWSSSLDGTIRLWDLRTNKVAQVYSSQLGSEGYTAFDINISDEAILAGTELCGDVEPSGKIRVWDVRSTNPLTELVDSHTDDVTQLVCHPTSRHHFLSGALDHLACFYDMKDLMNEDRDFGIVATINTEQPITKLGFCGSDYRQVYVTSHVESFSIWNYEEAHKMVDLKDVRGDYGKSSSIDYIVDCVYNSKTEDLFLIGGTYQGATHVFLLRDTNLTYKFSLSGGHSDIVRCLDWNFESGCILTGGEDSRLCLWTKSSEMPSSSHRTPISKSAASKSEAGLRFRPY